MFSQFYSNHHNHFAFFTSGTTHSTNHDNPSHPIQYRFNYCLKLPPLENNCNYFGSPRINSPVDHYNHHVNPQSHFVIASINHSAHHQAEQSLQRESNKQLPKTSCIGKKSIQTKLKKLYPGCLQIPLLQWITQCNSMYVLLQKRHQCTITGKIERMSVSIIFFIVHCMSLFSCMFLISTEFSRRVW